MRGSGIDRRTFLRRAGVLAACAGTVIHGCGKGAFDLVIAGGLVYDGLGGPAVETDVAVRGDRIVRMERHLNPGLAQKVIDARGLSVCPGLIDVHSHIDVELMVDPKAESKVRQGVTTEIGGNCGSRHFRCGPGDRQGNVDRSPPVPGWHTCGHRERDRGR